MNPFYEYRLKHQYRPQDHKIADAPTPWRAIYPFAELAQILDASGHVVTLCRREIAERIVAAVNGVAS